MRKMFIPANVHINLKDGTTDSGVILACTDNAVKIKRNKTDSEGTRYPTYFKDEVISVHLGSAEGEELHFA